MKIQFALTESELNAVYAFRYRIYVEEMRRPQRHADHVNRKISDPLDRTAFNIVATDNNDSVLGCVRVNFVRYGGLEYYVKLMNIAAVGGEYEAHAAVCTRFMVDPKFRKTSLAARLCKECFELGQNNQIFWNFIDCNDPLVNFFGRMGYIHLGQAEHEEYGLVNVMRFDLLDRRHLAARSIFSRAARRPMPRARLMRAAVRDAPECLQLVEGMAEVAPFPKEASAGRGSFGAEALSGARP